MSEPKDEQPKPRVTRPEPERTSPLRSWATLFGPQSANAAAGDEGSGNTTASGGASLTDVVSRSVELGYRVVDDYLRQGERAAERLGGGQLGARGLTTDVQDFAGRMTRYASDFLGLWLEFLEIAATGRGGAGPTATPAAPGDHTVPAPSATAAAAPGEPARVRIEIVSARPAEVTVELRPDVNGAALVVHALRAVDPEKPRVEDVTLRRAEPDGPLTLRIRVPDGHPAGVYNGLIIETTTSRPVGTVSVRLEAVT